tara:strand:- start:312 stop:1025 length:714 start_codon:yes stop_codon:yes gene_type:complete
MFNLILKDPLKQMTNKIADQSPSKERLLDVIRALDGSTAETFDKSKTIFFPGDPAKKIYLVRKGAVRLSRMYESGEENIVALLRENSLFGVVSFLNDHQAERKYHAVALTSVALETAPAISLRKAIDADTRIGLLLVQGLSNRILQTETIIESLTHKDIFSKLVNFLLVLSEDFGVSGEKGIIIDLHISHQDIADAIGSTRVTITRLLGELKNLGLLAIDQKKIIIFDPKALIKDFK